jgi:protein phosphatase
VTHRGLVRPHNEDSLSWDLDLGLYIVADGMGGHNAGEVASQMAVETITQFIERTRDPDDCTWPFELDPTVSFNANRVMNAMLLANRRVFHEGEAREEYNGMGTTATVALIQGSHLTVGGIGDSRLYSLLGGDFVQLTVDDSWVARMVANDPSLTRADLAASPLRNALTNVIGAREQTSARVTERVLTPGELLLLCSDGLHSLVEDEVIRQILLDHPMEPAADALVAAALERGGRDNITVLIVRYVGAETQLLPVVGLGD